MNNDFNKELSEQITECGVENMKKMVKHMEENNIKILTGVDKIDDILSGGLKQGELYMVAGSPTKTIFNSNNSNYYFEMGLPTKIINSELYGKLGSKK